MKRSWKTAAAIFALIAVFCAGFWLGHHTDSRQTISPCLSVDSRIDPIAENKTEPSKRDEEAVAKKSDAAVSIDPNSDDWRTLAELPGIGPKMAERIIETRRKFGPYRVAEDLLRVAGIGPVKLSRIKPYLSIPEATQFDKGD